MTTENRTSHPARAASLAAFIVILLPLIVFPGFLAAGLSRGTRPMVTLGIEVEGIITSKSAIISSTSSVVFDCDGLPALHVIFIPAEWVMRVFPAMSDFYFWQYYLAGGGK